MRLQSLILSSFALLGLAVRAEPMTWQFGQNPKEPVAWMYSREVVNPYETSQFRSPNPVGLTIRLRGKRAPEITLGQEKGSFYCPKHRCEVSVQFDDQPAERWPAYTEPIPWAPRSDNHFMLWLDRSPALLQKLQQSQQLRLELLSYPKVTMTVHFTYPVLEWPATPSR